MANVPTLTRRLLRTKQAATYLSMSEWKLRRLIQSEIIPFVQDQRGGPFLVDLCDLDTYIEVNKHRIGDADGWEPTPVLVAQTSGSSITEGQMTRRQRGTGRIFLPKGSSVWWLQYYQNGVKQRESAETTERKEALNRLKRRVAEVTTGTFTGPNPKRVRISELAEDFLRDYRVNGKASVDDAEARWRLHIEPFFGSLRASQVTSVLLDKYVDKRQQEGAANATINRELAALKRMFNLGRAATPPKIQFVPHFPKLTEDNVRQGFLEDDQYQRLLESCPELWFQAIVETGSTYGWRVGELLKLKVKQIDIEKGVIRLEPGTTKNKKGREVTMTDLIRDLFAMCIEGKSPDDYLFTRSDGKRVRIFRDTWENAVVAAGVPHLLFHDLRRTAARNLRRAGIAETVIMKIGGWLTRSVFERYAIVAHADVVDAMDQLVAYRRETELQLAANQHRSKGGGRTPTQPATAEVNRPHDRNVGERPSLFLVKSNLV